MHRWTADVLLASDLLAYVASSQMPRGTQDFSRARKRPPRLLAEPCIALGSQGMGAAQRQAPQPGGPQPLYLEGSLSGSSIWGALNQQAPLRTAPPHAVGRESDPGCPRSTGMVTAHACRPPHSLVGTRGLCFLRAFCQWGWGCQGADTGSEQAGPGAHTEAVPAQTGPLGTQQKNR